MAFTYATTLPSGIKLRRAYVRINKIQHRHSIGLEDVVTVKVTIHKHLKARKEGLEPVAIKTFKRVYDDTQTSSLEDMYKYLMSLPEFKGSKHLPDSELEKLED
jgi:hypothetical protein